MSDSSDQAREVERVRIICRDRAGLVLLIKWRDPTDGRVFFEPPGGGIEAGETPRAVAERELYEETGFRAELDTSFVAVGRDYHFAGRHFQHLEAFYLTEVDGGPRAADFTEEEEQTFVEWRFVDPNDLASLDAPLEPPSLAEVLGALGVSEGRPSSRPRPVG